METAILILCILIFLAALSCLIVLIKKPKSDDDGIEVVAASTDLIKQKIEEESRFIRESAKDGLSSVVSALSELNKSNNEIILGGYRANSELINQRIEGMEKLVIEFTQNNDKRMQELKSETGKQLSEMREIVDEKLSKTLDERLTKSFELISGRLEAVSKGLGEMQALASNVTDLKKVLTNVKTRGVWGEVSLGNLLEQTLTKDQYTEFGDVDDGTQKRVDFAVLMPGKKEGEKVYLPIDAKFPMEDYLRLVEASEAGDSENVKIAGKALSDNIKKSAKSIAEKYINPPKTTDFAIMYLPTEGLYSEIVKNSDLIDELQNKYKIVPAGPVNLSAMLNSLQMGFRTLAIEKRSVEVWNILAAFKKEFVVFSDLVSKTKQQIDRASATLDSASKKTETIQKKLKNVQLLDEEKIEEIAAASIESDGQLLD